QNIQTAFTLALFASGFVDSIGVLGTTGVVEPLGVLGTTGVVELLGGRRLAGTTAVDRSLILEWIRPELQAMGGTSSRVLVLSETSEGLSFGGMSSKVWGS